MPYSGTRSLMEHLGVDHYEHFGSSPSFFARDDFEAHIPVRDPLAVARSWARRGKPLDELLMRFRAMIDFVAYRDNVVLWVTEELPIVRGNGEYTEDEDRVTEYQQALISMVNNIKDGTTIVHG